MLVEEVVFKAGTPGIATAATDTTLQVGFEPGLTLTFVTKPWHKRIVEADTKYYLGVNYWTSPATGKVAFATEYGGEKYTIVRGKEVFLLVRETKLYEREKKKRTVRGMVLEK